MADFDYDGPADPGPRHERLYVPPVTVRLEGPERAVTAALGVLREVFTVADVSSVFRNDNGEVHQEMVISRDFPYSGGSK